MPITLESLTPLHAHCTVELDDFDEKYGAGLIIKPFNENDKSYYTATVLAAGPQAPVKPGDRIMIDRHVRDVLDGILGKNVVLVDGAAGFRCDIFGVVT